jgi:transcriptional regulator with XRE-family HTH domain
MLGLKSEQVPQSIGEKTVRELVGYRLRRARVDRHLTQEQLAVKAQMSRASLANIECGRQDISVYTLYRLASELDVAFPELFPQELWTTDLTAKLELPANLPTPVETWIRELAENH